MKERKDPPAELLSLATEQGGCLTREQCLRGGMSPESVRRLLRTQWRARARGVYCLGAPGWDARVWTALLACSSGGAVVGSHAAAHLDGIVVSEPQKIVVWTGSHWVKRPPPDVICRRGERRGHGSPRRSWPEDTLLDLAWDRADQGELVLAVGRAFSEGLTTPGRLLEALGRRSRQAERGLITQLCGDLRGVESQLELRFVSGVQRPHGLPVPQRQARSDPGRYDNLFRDHGVAVELDGALFHRGRRLRDMHRDNASLVELGYVTLRYGWHDVVTRPCAVAAEIATVLARRGWTGRLIPCARCSGIGRGDG